MNLDNHKKLFASAPIFFSGKDKPITENLMPFGCECGDGWFTLIHDVAIAIEAYNRKHPDSEYPIIATQIKEKYAGLRLYVSGAPDEIWGLIEKAEEDSLKTCEVCGQRGGLYSKGYWLFTRCVDCAKENNLTKYREEDMP